MKNKLIKIFIIIIIMLILAVIIPLDIFAKMDTNITLGTESDLKSSQEVIERMLGVAQLAGSIISIIALIIIGIRYMVGSSDQKASLKGVIPYYIIGCVLVFATSNVLGFAYDVINDIRHDWDEGTETTSPTCIGTGILTYKCITCGEERTEVISSTGIHVWDSGVIEKAPTCVEKGIRKYTCRYGCGATKTSDVPININNHNWGPGIIDPAATCYRSGKKTYYCQNLGCEKTKEEHLIQLTHWWPETWSEEKSPTCIEKGQKVKRCLNGCGDKKTQEIPATGHRMDSFVKTEATCGSAGEAIFKCIHGCGYEYSRTVPATGNHEWNSGTVSRQPTCATMGKTKYTCIVCGKTKEETNIPKSNNHDWNWSAGSVTTVATCTQSGITSYPCKNGCGEKYKSESGKNSNNHSGSLNTTRTKRSADTHYIVSAYSCCGYKVKDTYENCNFEWQGWLSWRCTGCNQIIYE